MAAMLPTVDDNALVAALAQRARLSFEKYQMAKMTLSQDLESSRVILESSILEFQEAKVAWERFEVASATVVGQRSKEEREDIGGHAQDHEVPDALA